MWLMNTSESSSPGQRTPGTNASVQNNRNGFSQESLYILTLESFTSLERRERNFDFTKRKLGID